MDKRKIRRVVSMVVAMSMTLSVVASAVEAAVATWLAPQPGQTFTARNIEVAVGYNTHSDLCVTRLELWVDGRMHAKKILVRPESRGVCSFWWDTAGFSDGPHNLAVKIYAGSDLISTVRSTGTVGNCKYDLRPPTVSFTNIKNGDVLKGVTTLKLNANDDSGEPPVVSLLVDKSLKLVQNRPPYDYDLDTTGYSDGDHEIKSFAFDGAGNKSDAAVVQVAFKNGAEKPVVASLSVKSHSNPEQFDESPSEAVPTMSGSSSVPSARNSAARSDSVMSGASSASVPSTPVASVPNAKTASTASPTMRMSDIERSYHSKTSSAVKPVITAEAAPIAKIAPALEPAKVSIPAVSAKPNQIISSQLPAMRSGSVESIQGAISARTAEPIRNFESYTSPVAPVDASWSASGKSVIPHAMQASGSPAQPEQSSEAIASDLTQMAMSPATSIRSESIRAEMSDSANSAQEPVAPLAANPKPVRVAAVPYVKDINSESASNRAYACTPQLKKDTRAKLEKRTAPASGKVKLRDLYNNLSGILFWDSENHTVTAISNDMKIELKIGSKVATVNCKQMQISEAPYIVNGRTVIDVSIYHQASEFILRTASK
ncbi:MAG: Ig-like domain-containing protein [Armatimonadota bacterium]